MGRLLWGLVPVRVVLRVDLVDLVVRVVLVVPDRDRGGRTRG